MAIIQPNVDSYDRTISDREIEHIILDLVGELPASVDLVVLSETIMPRYYWESAFDSSPFVGELRDSMSARGLSATVVVGANTMVPYYGGEHPYTARPMRGSQSIYYDLFNTAAAISIDDLQLRHKSKLVIGVERTPKWLLDIFELLSVDMGSITVGQIGQGGAGESFDVDGVRVGAAVCYEGLYGEFFGDFVRDGAQIMTIISNDCWWDNTPGYRHLYSLSALRAVEYRRPIARCANTGISGYIDERGVSLESMAWGERGVMIRTIVPNDELTFYAKNCDLLGRVALLLAALSLLYYVSYRVRKRHYLVD